jgi:hypothetical protein
MAKKRNSISLREQQHLNAKNILYEASALLSALCFISSFATVQHFFEDIPPDKSQLFEVNGVIETDHCGKYNGIKVKDFETGETYTCSRICNYTGRKEDVGKTGKFMIYKSTVCEIEVDGQTRMNYEGTVKFNNIFKTICVSSFAIGVVFLLIRRRIAS